MPYIQYIWTFKGSIEYEYVYSGNNGAKGEKRRKKYKPTPEQVKRQNQINKENRMRRLIKANFNENDYWCTLKYPAGSRPGIDRVTLDLKNFNKKMQRAYKKYNQEYKYIYRIEVGKKGGVHIHIIINRIRDGPATDKLIREKWITHKVNYQQLDQNENYDALAKYIVKEYEDDTQLSLFDLPEQKKLIRYSSSRNLVRPKPVKKIFKRRTMRKILHEGPTAKQGYKIDTDSIKQGVNPYTGRSFLKYTEIRIRGKLDETCQHIYRS